MKPEKVIIIGGGPAGLAASLYLGRADLSPLVISGSPPGGQLTLTSEVENYPGFDSILGNQLIQQMRRQAKKFGARFIDQNVTRVDFSQKPFKLYVAHQEYRSKTVLVATGAKANWLNLPSEQRLRGKGVSACAVCDGFFFRNKTVAVVGGGDTAMEEALTLTKFAKKVFIIHRRQQFRASKILQKRVFNNQKIEIVWNAVVNKVLGDNRVEGAELKITSQKASEDKVKKKVLKLDGLFIAIGHQPATEFLKDSGLLLDKKGYILTSANQALTIARRLANGLKKEKGLTKKLTNNLLINRFDFSYQTMTSVAGVFAAGDVVDPVFRQAATAVGLGVAAALEVERYLTNPVE